MATTLTAASTILLATIVLRLIGKIYDLETRIKILEKIAIETEYRCPKCNIKDQCPAAFTGVAYPCEHFEKEDADGNEE